MGPSVFMRGSCVFSGKNHSVCRHNCDHTAIPLGWGREDADVRPTARGHPRGSWQREVDDEVGHRLGARQQVPHGRGQVRGEAADLPEHRPEGMNHAVGRSGQDGGGWR